MKITMLMICLAMLSNAIVSREIIELNNKNIDDEIKENQASFILFTSSKCDKCKGLDDIFNEVNDQLTKTSSENKKPVFMKLDVEQHKEAGDKYNINKDNLPIIRYYDGESGEDYMDAYHAVNIFTYIRRKMGEVIHEFKTSKALEEFAKHFEVVLAFLGDHEKHYELFSEFAHTTNDIIFIKCNSEACLEHYKAIGGNIVGFKSFDLNKIYLTKDYNEDTLKAFINMHSLPNVASFSSRAYEYMFSRQNPSIVFFRDKEKDSNHYTDVINSLNEKFRGIIQFIISDIKGEYEVKLAEFIGVKVEMMPTIRIIDTRDTFKKYAFSGELNAENLEAFINNWKDGKLESYTRSEVEPSQFEQEEAVIKKVVATNYKQMVSQEDKHVMVAFYDPWCDKCLHLAGIWHYLRLALKDTNPNIELLKFDHTANDSEIHVDTYPTIFLYKIGEKDKPIELDGEDRSMAKYINFLKEHIQDFKTFEFKEPDFNKEQPNDEPPQDQQELGDADQTDDSDTNKPEDQKIDL